MILLASLTPLAVHMGYDTYAVRIDEEHGGICDEINEDLGKLIT